MKAHLIVFNVIVLIVAQFFNIVQARPQYGWYGSPTQQTGYPASGASGALPAYSFPQGYGQYGYMQQGGLSQLPYYTQTQYGKDYVYNGYGAYSPYWPDNVVVDIQSPLGYAVAK